MRLNDIISEQTVENRLKNFCEIKEGFPDADFWLQRRGDVKTVGQPLKEYSPENIGIKVTSTDILDPKFLYYAMLHLHSQGYWRNKTRGILNLVHIKVSDVQNVPVSQKLDEQEKNGKLSVEDIHNLADFKCVKWDSDPKFLKKTKELTGKEHLDDLDQSGLEKIYTWLNSLPDKINEKRDACYYKVKRRYKIWPSAYACVPEESSKALSRTGWKSVDELAIGEEILTYNMNTDVLEFKPIINLHRYKNAATSIIKSGNTGFIFECTPDHKWVVKMPTSKSVKNNYEASDLALIETKSLLNNKRGKSIVVSAPFEGGQKVVKNKIFKYGDNWIKYVLDISPEQRQSWLFSAIIYDGDQKKPKRSGENQGNSSDLDYIYTGNHGRQSFGFKQKDVEHRDAFLLSAFLNGGTVTWKLHASGDIYSCYYVSNKRTKNLDNFKVVRENTTDVWCPETENNTWVMMQETDERGVITITGNSGALVKCRKKGAKNWGKSKKKVSEAPLADYDFIDFESPKRFSSVDTKLVQHPVTKLKTEQFFSKTPYNFRLFFAGSPGLRKYVETGVQKPETVRQIFNNDADKILRNSENAITVVFLGNSGAEKVPMTSWTMAHRIGHAMAASERGTQGGAWKDASEFFIQHSRFIINNYYGIRGSFYDNRTVISQLFNNIGTQRSSRKKLINRPNEFLYEMFAQYIQTGEIKLNPLPEKFTYGRKAWGHPTNYISLKKEFNNQNVRYGATGELASELMSYFDQVLTDYTNKILFM